jgi:hypothetical protein
MSIPPLAFIIPGFSKCGTTTLCHLLNDHPDIYIPTDKEPLFFIRKNYDNEWQDYRGFFGNYEPHQKLGEGSTFYSTSKHEQEARSRILKHYPEVKIIFIARDPVDRIESSFREFHHSGCRFEINTDYILEHALHNLPALIEDTRYWMRLVNYLDYMPRNQIHITLLEDLKSNPQQELAKCFRFLGVDEDLGSPLPQRLNQGENKLYDRKLLRWMRIKGWVNKPETEQAFIRQNQQFRSVGLRSKFKHAINWSDNATSLVRDELGEDIIKFLKCAGKPLDYWPRFAKLFREHG